MSVRSVAALLAVAALGCQSLTGAGARNAPPKELPPLQPPPDNMFCPADPSYGIGTPPPERTAEMLSELEVKTFLKERFPVIRECYELRVKRGYDIGGHVGLRFDVSPQGYVQRLCLVEDQTGDRAFLECLLGEVGTWQWPPKTAATEVRQRWNFQHGD